MKQIFSIIKKYIPAILLIIILLILQAMCDLALPDYTSNIINVGIQQKGIESATPEKISKESMEHICIFVSAENRDKIFSKYDNKNGIYQIVVATKLNCRGLHSYNFLILAARFGTLLSIAFATASLSASR